MTRESDMERAWARWPYIWAELVTACGCTKKVRVEVRPVPRVIEVAIPKPMPLYATETEAPRVDEPSTTSRRFVRAGTTESGILIYREEVV